MAPLSSLPPPRQPPPPPPPHPHPHPHPPLTTTPATASSTAPTTPTPPTLTPPPLLHPRRRSVSASPSVRPVAVSPHNIYGRRDSHHGSVSPSLAVSHPSVMAHIASCLASPGQPPDLPPPPPPPSQVSKKPHAWRMLPADPQPRYQLFPRDKPAPTTDASSLRPRPSHQRRRKVNVPDLGPMTTVHEVPMDSPTIPGLAPLHETGADSPSDEAPVPPPKDCKPLVIAQKRPGPVPHLRTLKSASSLRTAPKPTNESPWTASSDVSHPDRVLVTPSHSTPDLSLPRSAATDGTSSTTLTTPISAALTEPQRVSPRPWDGPGAKDQGESSRGHRRWISESSGMPDRGRPRRRVKTPDDAGPTSKAVKESGCEEDLDRTAFEALPRGFRPYQAVGQLTMGDVASLQYQAHRQAERFEVLKKEDVEALSREIRKLDEWTEHIRHTYASLRAARRNLHSRIRQYLSSPRVGRFSFESMLKQEERLAELDASIDDWVAQLDQVENRRTRVRQKLLEHVAAASLLPVATGPDAGVVPPSPAPRDISTPPRSPSSEAVEDDGSAPGVAPPDEEPPKLAQPDPRLKRKALVELEPVPEPEPELEPEPEPEPEPQHEEPEEAPDSRVSVQSPRRPGVESIRVYMGGDVFTLLADVENEFSKLSDEENNNDGSQAPAPAGSPSSLYSPASWLVTPRTPACWRPVEEESQGARSPETPTPPTPPLKDYPKPPEGATTLLTSAVFKP
ncbi:hypothetical protein XA68_15368 [Ophiocordyceps unilateralis]|uniref:Up-regulated during septation protein 1 domain-containing protein n=1 Tax=Ophiocordyceps unilateralis TaxID=268505 RepID=A0A2A9PKL6_OPHUN|nr:hypothetical protein XA68_15368 [Ophiocordyceps unilateralis]